MRGQFDTIKGLAQKLARLADADSGATDAERQNAASKLEALLQKHGLSADDIADEKLHNVAFVCASKAEQQLLFNCAAFILNGGKFISTYPRRWKKGKSEPVTINGITHTQAADIRICFDHYRRELSQRVQTLENEIRTRRTMIRNAAAAIIQKNEIFPEREDEAPTRKPNLKRLREVMLAMRGLDANRWEKPAGKVGDSQLALGWNGGTE